MTFTKEEREKLIANGKAIEKFIREEIMPNLRDKVEVDFGDVDHDYSLWVTNRELGMTCGYLSLSFEEHIDRQGEVSLYNPGHGHVALYALSLNWRHGEFIRSCLVTAVEKQNEQHKKVFDTFEV